MLNYCLSTAATLLLTVLFVPSTVLAAEAQESVAADKPAEIQDAVTFVSPTSIESEIAVSKVRLHSLVEVRLVSAEHQFKTSLSEPEANSLTFETDRTTLALPELDQASAKSTPPAAFSLSPADKISTTAADLKMSTDESAQSPSWDRLMRLTKVAQTPNDSEPANTNSAQATPEQPQEKANLAQEAQNPIANLISVPLQNNFNFNVGQFDRTQYVLNIQPVVPVPLSKDWLLVTRTIVPLISQPTAGIDPTTQELRPGDATFGLGDINPQFFFVPKTGSNLTWGVGPIFLLPTATNDVLGTDKWGAGPNGVVVWTKGKWLVGALVNQLWSFAGDNDRPDVSQFLVQPFINYSLPDGWTIGTSPSITANWNAAEGDKWTVPLGASVSKLLAIGTQPVSVALAGYYNVERPSFGPDWTLRFTFTLLFPTRK